MINMKTSGGLIHGQGMNESQHAQWLLSMPAYSDVNIAMQELNDTDFVTFDQHKDMTEAKQKREDKDMIQLPGFLRDRNPLSSDWSLRNIASGVIDYETVNADNAKEIGKKILE